MKPFVYSLAILFVLFIGAFKKDAADRSNQSLTGKWKLYSTYGSIGGPGAWTNAGSNDTNYVQFYNDGKLQSNLLSEFSSYTFKDSVTLALSRKDGSIENYNYRIKKDSLIMSPSGPVICIEGCSTKFVKQ